MTGTTEITQGTDAWRQQRLGKVTASRVADVVRKVKSGGWASSRANYMADLIAERLTGNPTIGYTNAAMQWGVDTEPRAREDYQFYTGLIVETVSFIDHPRIALTGASPDGLVGDDGLVEFKCPNTATHIETLLGAPIDPDYIKQVQWQMACKPERAWCDWVSYDPRLPVEMQMHIRRVNRDSGMIRELEGEVRIFQQELEHKITALQEKHGMIERAQESALA